MIAARFHRHLRARRARQVDAGGVGREHRGDGQPRGIPDHSDKPCATVVGDDHRRGSGGLGVDRLEGEVARAALHEGDAAVRVFTEAGWA